MAAEKEQALLKETQQQRRDLQLPALLKRQFQQAAASQNDTLPSNNSQPVLRVMQWNLLAQALSQGDDNFVLCPVEALNWENRKLHVLEEILSYRSTIMCLEEVDHFKYLKDVLSQVGYDGCFFPKPDSPCLYSDVHYGPDGCAVFWKADQVKLEMQKNVILQNDAGKETNQVAVLCHFSHLATQKRFHVAVTHLKSKPPYWQLRHEQGKYLEKVLQESVPQSSPLIVCGDFNAEPSEQVYATFRSSSLGLDSSYRHLTEQLEEPSYTTWKIRGGLKGNKETAHCIDYIWFSTNHFRPVSLLKFPTGEEIGKDRLPSLIYPSDHLSLVVDFMFAD
ncbi:nocturnin-like [Babylonia areolata]|uniref:nocturnin-like n=1 Tax=Babylonia areolata TaxID=304850 RepID=UPI003FD35BE4